jgi:hypothetical protein
MKILMQTTIPNIADDWNIGRFSMLCEHLTSLGHTVIARNRENGENGDDPVLGMLDRSDFDQLWLFAVDTGDGITKAECGAITRFHEDGGALFVTRDHMDLGVSICDLGGIGAAHYFHSRQRDPDAGNRRVDDTGAPDISWPNYHSGDNGDVQRIIVVGPVHPVLEKSVNSETVATLPAHPHEGAVGAPPDDPNARVVVRGTSSQTGRQFNIAVAFEASGKIARGWAESTFHHFCDYNWDIRKGCPSFVGEKASDAIARNPALLDDTKIYVRNLAAWLGERRR